MEQNERRDEVLETATIDVESCQQGVEHHAPSRPRRRCGETRVDEAEAKTAMGELRHSWNDVQLCLAKGSPGESRRTPTGVYAVLEAGVRPCPTTDHAGKVKGETKGHERIGWD